MQVFHRENHVKISPHQIAMVQVEFFEIPKLPVFCDVGIQGFAQKRLEVHDTNHPIVERQTNLAAGNVSGLDNLQIFCRPRFHLIFRVMISGFKTVDSPASARAARVQWRPCRPAWSQTARLRAAQSW